MKSVQHQGSAWRYADQTVQIAFADQMDVVDLAVIAFMDLAREDTAFVTMHILL